jgi:hypothetical protein
MSSSIIGGRLTWIPIVVAFVLGCLSFFSGYLLYLGNFYGRTASLVFLFSNLVVWIMSVCDVWYSSGFIFVGIMRFIVLGIFLIIMLYFIASPICRNNYRKGYRSHPIRLVPLPAWKKTALLVWGSLMFGLLVFISCTSMLLMRNQFLTYEPTAENTEKITYKITLDGETFIIPKPKKAKLVSTENRATGYANTVVLSFAESNSFSSNSYTVDCLLGKKVSTSPQSFALMNSSLKSLMDEIGSPLKVVAESTNFIIRQDDGGLFVRGKLCDAQVLMRGQILTLRMSSRSWGVRPSEMLAAMQEWIQEIIAANHNIQQ